jgi:hypothetical protein
MGTSRFGRVTATRATETPLGRSGSSSGSSGVSSGVSSAGSVSSGSVSSGSSAAAFLVARR